MKKYSIFILLLIALHNIAISQAPIFDSYPSTRAHLNPVLAGTDSTLIVLLSNHSGNNSTTSNDIEENTFHFSVDQYVHFLRGGIGINAISENEFNITKTKGFSISYAPHFELFNHKLSIQPGISVGYSQRTFDGERYKSKYNIVYDPRINYITYIEDEIYTKNNIDIDAGLFIYSKKLYGGVSIKNITQPDEAEPDYGFYANNTIPYLITINTGAILNFKKSSKGKFTFSPTFMCQLQEHDTDYRLELTTKLNWVLLGVVGSLHYETTPSRLLRTGRTQHYTSFLLGAQTNYFRIGYSVNIDIISSYYHEIQISGFIPYKHRNKNRKTIRLI